MTTIVVVRRQRVNQLTYQLVVLENNIKIYIKTAPTCFGVTVTPSSGSALICVYYRYCKCNTETCRSCFNVNFIVNFNIVF